MGDKLITIYHQIIYIFFENIILHINQDNESEIDSPVS